MAEHSTIEWTDATWNPITGCTLVSEGCRHCYAATLAATRLKHHPSRMGLARINAAGEAKFTGEVRLNERWLDQPLRWTRPRMIFVCAHGDLFHEAVPDEWIDRVFAVMALTPRHTHQVLTKRPGRAQAYLSHQYRQDAIEAAAGAWFGEEAECFVSNWINGWSMPQETPRDTNPANGTARRWPLPNVWLGTSIEDQATADARIPYLLATPAAVRFVSAEPLLGPVNLNNLRWPRDVTITPIDSLNGGGGEGLFLGGNQICLDWVIVGGESGKRARPMHPDWARSLRDQCQAAGVAFFFKQWGEWGRHRPVAGGDLGGDVRRGKVRIVHPSGRSAIEVSEATGGRNTEIGSLYMARLGKARAGRLLDGREWSEMPGVRA